MNWKVSLMRIFLQKMFVFTAREVMAPANTVRRGFFMALAYLVKSQDKII